MLIDDGTGRGYRARVDEDHRLLTLATTESAMSHAARVHATAYSWVIVSYDFDAGDTILLVRNDSPTLLLYIDYAWAWIKTDGAILLQHPTAAFTGAGTAVVGANLNTLSGVAADASAWADETGNTQGTILDMRYCPAAASQGVEFLAQDGLIVLGHEESLGIDAVIGGDECLAVMQGYFHAPPD